VLWPDHCVQGTYGAQFLSALDTAPIAAVFRKGTNPDVDSYSAFYDNAHRISTGLGEHLRALGIHEIYIMGLATDYCVQYSALDARQLGFHTHVVCDGCRAVELREGDADRAWEAMRHAGVVLVESNQLA
jgi:nicotinamidase/pyrazinamidase